MEFSCWNSHLLTTCDNQIIVGTRNAAQANSHKLRLPFISDIQLIGNHLYRQIVSSFTCQTEITHQVGNSFAIIKDDLIGFLVHSSDLKDVAPHYYVTKQINHVVGRLIANREFAPKGVPPGGVGIGGGGKIFWSNG